MREVGAVVRVNGPQHLGAPVGGTGFRLRRTNLSRPGLEAHVFPPAAVEVAHPSGGVGQKDDLRHAFEHPLVSPFALAQRPVRLEPLADVADHLQLPQRLAAFPDHPAALHLAVESLAAAPPEGRGDQVRSRQRVEAGQQAGIGVQVGDGRAAKIRRPQPERPLKRVVGKQHLSTGVGEHGGVLHGSEHRLKLGAGAFQTALRQAQAAADPLGPHARAHLCLGRQRGQQRDQRSGQHDQPGNTGRRVATKARRGRELKRPVLPGQIQRFYLIKAARCGRTRLPTTCFLIAYFLATCSLAARRPEFLTVQSDLQVQLAFACSGHRAGWKYRTDPERRVE